MQKNLIIVNESKYFGQYIAAFIMSLMSVTTGTALGWSSAAAPILQNPPNTTNGNQLEAYSFQMTTDEFSLAAGAINFAGVFTSLPLGYIITKYGCRSTVFVLTIPVTVGWILVTLAQNSLMLLIGRFITGLAAISYVMCGAIYIGEISGKTIRGALGSLQELLTRIGIFVTFVLGYCFTIPEMSLICLMISIITTGLVIFIPESPYHLLVKNRGEEAVKTIKWLRGRNFNATAELDRIITDQSQLLSINNSLWTNLRKRSSVKSILIGLELTFIFQMCGINIVQFYSTTIFISAGIDIEPAIGTIIIGIVEVIALLMGTYLIDRLGRRILLTISGAGMTISTTLLGLFFYYHELDESLLEGYHWIPLVCLIIFVIMDCIGYGFVVWVILSEIFTQDIKSVACAVSAIWSSILGFLVAIIFPLLRDHLGSGPAFWFFSFFSFIGMLIPIFLLPETKGKTLEEVQFMMAGVVPNKKIQAPNKLTH